MNRFYNQWIQVLLNKYRLLSTADKLLQMHKLILSKISIIKKNFFEVKLSKLSRFGFLFYVRKNEFN